MKGALKFKKTQVPRQTGELARLKVAQGPDLGSIFVITSKKVTMGRGDECDVVMTDLKASRVHAEISIIQNGSWQIKDLESANGILLNNKAVKQAPLSMRDLVTIGETIVEFVTSENSTQILNAPLRSFAEIQSELAHRVSTLTPSAPNHQETQKKRNLTLGVVLIGLFLMFGMDNKTVKKPNKKSKETERSTDLATYLPKADSTRTVETLFKDGMREYFVGNYGRAKTQFETVLQIVPTHNLAKIYLENCNKSLEGLVKLYLERGKKAFQAGKLHEAKGHYERVMRILFRDQSNPAFIESKDQYEKLVKMMSEEQTE